MDLTDLTNPLNPINPISPLNPINQQSETSIESQYNIFEPINQGQEAFLIGVCLGIVITIVSIFLLKEMSK